MTNVSSAEKVGRARPGRVARRALPLAMREIPGSVPQMRPEA
jgi:hypothetical protein